MKRSEQCHEIFAALAKAQGQVQGAHKDSQNPHYRSQYADLESCWDACREAASVNGLCVTQEVTTLNDGVNVVTLLGHSSGQWIEYAPLFVPSKFDAHGVGSGGTYGRRYALCAVMGIAPTDDDGNAAVGKPNPQGTQTKQEPRREPPKPPAKAPAKVEAPKAEEKAKEAVSGPAEDVGPHPGGEGTERMERKSTPPPANRPRDPGVQLAIRACMKKLKDARPEIYPTGAACEQRCIDATGVKSSALTADLDDVFLASLQAEMKEHGVSA